MSGDGGRPVEVRRLTKTFFDEGRGEVHAVDGIEFECERGQIFGLLGANGAGKTTTLRMLATILTPSSECAVRSVIRLSARPEVPR